MQLLQSFKFFILLFILTGVFFISGCETVPKISPEQRRALQVRGFEASYNNVFRAFKSVLQDEGYIIKNQDMAGGLIVAHASRKSSNMQGVIAVMGALSGSHPQNYKTGVTYEVSVNLEKIRKNYTESRVIIQEVASYSMGGSRGQEVFSPELYKNIYNKVMREVARRKMRNR